MSVYGLSKYDPVYIQKMLFDLKIKPEEIAVTKVTQSTKVFFAFSLKDLKTNLADVNSGVILTLVFGSPVVYDRYSIEFLDSVNKNSLKELLRLNEYRRLKLNNKSIAMSMLAETKPSIFKGLLTTLYKIPDKSFRDKTRKLMFKVMMNSKNLTDFESTLISLSDNKKVVRNILKSVESSLLDRTIKAVRKVRKNKLTELDAAIKYNIAEFDIRYVLSQKTEAKYDK